MIIGQPALALARRQSLPSIDVSRQDATSTADDDIAAGDGSRRHASAVSDASSMSVCSSLADARRGSVSPGQEYPDAGTATVTAATTAALALGNPCQATFLQPPTPGLLRPRVHAALTAALKAIGIPVATFSPHLEPLASLVDDLMSQPNRTYHTSEHVFELFEYPCDAPESTLAALLHDVVYIQIDGITLPPPVAGAMRALGLAPAVDDGPLSVNDLYIPKQTPQTPRELALVLLIFGHVFDAPLAVPGRNELLSALVASHVLRFLPSETLLRVLVCIEATIPFRSESSLSLLAKRSQRAADVVLGMQLDDSAVRDIVNVANSMAHRDVGNFAARDARMFLINTWRLFPESNVQLRSPQGVVEAALVDWNAALRSTLGFFQLLKADPARVFHAQLSTDNSGTTEAEAYALRLAYCARNLCIGELYVGAHIVYSVGLHALATAAGLTSLKLGDIATPEASLLPEEGGLEAFDYTDLNADCFAYAVTLSRRGRRGSNGTTSELIEAVPQRGDYFDWDVAPLALLAAHHLSNADALKAAVAAAISFHQGESDAATYLQSLPTALVSALQQVLDRIG